MDHFDRKVDLIAVLDDFDASQEHCGLWGPPQALMLERFARFSIRVRSSCVVRFSVNTSAVLYDADSEETASVDDAIKIIQARRASDDALRAARRVGPPLGREAPTTMGRPLKRR